MQGNRGGRVVVLSKKGSLKKQDICTVATWFALGILFLIKALEQNSLGNISQQYLKINSNDGSDIASFFQLIMENQTGGIRA